MFLDNLEKERKNSISSRNLRPTAIHSFYRLVAPRDPGGVGIATRVLAIPLWRTDIKVRPYVTREEMDAILAALDRSTWCGRRDHTLLLTVYNTGARVSEMSSLGQGQISFGVKSYVHLHGKGRKERSVPLWSRTARTIKEWLCEIVRNENALVFPNVRGGPLSRFAIHRLLRKAAQRGVCRCPSLRRKRVSPHVIRHGTAMALLQAGGDLAVIALWLGHESIETTNAYVHANLAMKEKALGMVLPMDTPFWRFHADDRLLAHLDSL